MAYLLVTLLLQIIICFDFANAAATLRPVPDLLRAQIDPITGNTTGHDDGSRALRNLRLKSTILLKQRIDVNKNSDGSLRYISGGGLDSFDLGRCYNERSGRFTGAWLLTYGGEKENLVVRQRVSDAYSEEALVSSTEYVTRVLYTSGEANVDFAVVSGAGKIVYEEIYRTKRNAIILYQIGYRAYESEAIKQNVLQSEKHYKDATYIHPKAKGDKATVDRFFDEFGRYYVSKVTKGVRAVRKVTFQFDSEETKKRIEATIKVKIGIGPLSKIFTIEYKKLTEDKKKDAAIEIAFANLGGNTRHLDLEDADFGENYENFEELLRSSWVAFMDDPSYLGVLSAELTVASSAILRRYRMDISDQMLLSRRVHEARVHIDKLKRQEALIQLTREKILNSFKAVGGGGITDYMKDFDNMSDDFLEYHLRVVIKRLEEYLVKNANVLTSDVPPKETLPVNGKPRAIDLGERNRRWLRVVKLTEAQMDEVFVHLKGDAYFVTELVGDGDTTYPILWDGVVAYGRHTGVPNRVFFYHDNEDVTGYSLSEKSRYRKFSIRGGDWDLLQERPLDDAVLVPNPNVAINFSKLPTWFRHIKYRMTKDYYLPARNYEGFWINGRFSDHGTLTNKGYTKNSFVSCLLHWSNPPIAENLVFGDGSVYSGGVKYVSIEMNFLMHGWGTLRHNNSKETTGCWKEGTLLPAINRVICNTLTDI